MARIGMVSIWFHRGQSEVTKTIRQALIDNGHEVFMFCRMGAVYGQNMQSKDDPYWKLPNVFLFPKYEIPAQALAMWAKVNSLDVIIFNEEYSPLLGMAIRSMGVKTVHYIDFMSNDWTNGLREGYNQLWSASQRTTDLLGDMGLADLTKHIGWGVPSSMPYMGDEEPMYDFFHNAGWLGINFRKGTDLVLRAYEKLIHDGLHASLLIHAQVPLQAVVDAGAMTQELHDLMRDDNYLTWHEGTVPPPGLYHLGKVVVQPSRMEGLGLTIVEGLYQGRELITTDAPPMNEFVKQSDDLVHVETTANRKDGLSFPECTVSIDDLAETMAQSLDSWKLYGNRNHRRATVIFDWGTFRSRIQNGLAALNL